MCGQGIRIGILDGRVLFSVLGASVLVRSLTHYDIILLISRSRNNPLLIGQHTKERKGW